MQIIGADPEGSVYSGGSGRPYLVEGVGEDFWPPAYDRTIADRVIAVSDRDSFLMTRRLAREEGLLVGGSCGMAVVAARQVAEEAGSDAVVVVLLPDGGRGYLSKIFDDGWMADYGFLVPESTEPKVGDVLNRKGAVMPELVHVHPDETVESAIAILREYGVSQMPVVRAEPPVMAAEVVGSVGRARAARWSRPRAPEAHRPARGSHGSPASPDRRGRTVVVPAGHARARRRESWCSRTASHVAS